MSAMAPQINGVSIVCSTNLCSGEDQRKHQSPASLAFVRGIQRWPVNSLHKGPITRKMFPFDDVIMRGLVMRNFDVSYEISMNNLLIKRWFEMPWRQYNCTMVRQVIFSWHFRWLKIPRYNMQIWCHYNEFKIACSSILHIPENTEKYQKNLLLWFR